MKRYHRILKLSKKINHNDLIYYSNSKTKSKSLMETYQKIYTESENDSPDVIRQIYIYIYIMNLSMKGMTKY